MQKLKLVLLHSILITFSYIIIENTYIKFNHDKASENFNNLGFSFGF